LILAPVVMVSSAAVILNGLMTHYGEVNGRIRDMNHELLDLSGSLGGANEVLQVERFHEIKHQLPQLLRRHGLVHDAMLAIYCAIAVLVLSMVASAVTAISDVAWLGPGIVGLLLLGTALLLFGVVLVAIEVHRGRQSIIYETQHLIRWERDPNNPGNGER
jgi:hypothetical protein